MKRTDFGNDFVWGVATAAYQIEGAKDADGKGESIWDRFTNKTGKIYGGHTGNTACDFYHRYPEDVAIMKSLNLGVHRFSLAWSRLLPQGTGHVNQAGIDYYNRLIDAHLEAGVQPWLTLYHWDLPQALEDKGGWTNRDILGWFAEYCDLATRAFGDRVKHWMVLNEPLAYCGAGYFMGIHAPGRKNLFSFLKAVHHSTLCQADGGRIVRANVPDAEVGTTFSCSHVEPVDNTWLHRGAARRFDAIINRLFIEPAFGLSYPFDAMPILDNIFRYYEYNDENRMKFDFDFIGLQNYTREKVRFSFLAPFIWANIHEAKNRGVKTTEMGWEVYPEGIYHLLHKFAAYDPKKKIYVTENGAAFPDTVTPDGRVHDPDRTQFLQDYLAQVLRAQREGVNVQGYLVWSYCDNFEWAEGYRTRFGLVHVDFDTQQRIIKDSGLWMRDFLAGA